MFSNCDVQVFKIFAILLKKYVPLRPEKINFRPIFMNCTTYIHPGHHHLQLLGRTCQGMDC